MYSIYLFQGSLQNESNKMVDVGVSDGVNREIYLNIKHPPKYGVQDLTTWEEQCLPGNPFIKKANNSSPVEINLRNYSDQNISWSPFSFNHNSFK